MDLDFLTQFFDSTLEGEGNAGIQAISALLNLSDENFSSISEYFLATFEKKVKQDPSIKKTIADAMRAEINLNLGSIDEHFEDSVNSIRTQLSDELSEQKIDFLVRFVTIGFNALREVLEEENNIFIPVEFCHENAKIPTYAHKTDAGLDIYALEDIIIEPGETKIIPTGLKVAIPAGYELQIRDKSGIASKTKLRVANAPATIKVA